jgi:hypothetical protein
MNAYETTGTVNDQGQIHLGGIPFAPGTEVEVKISPKAAVKEGSADDRAWAEARARMKEVLSRIKGFRNTPLIPREELYERGRVS